MASAGGAHQRSHSPSRFVRKSSHPKIRLSVAGTDDAPYCARLVVLSESQPPSNMAVTWCTWLDGVGALLFVGACSTMPLLIQGEMAIVGTRTPCAATNACCCVRRGCVGVRGVCVCVHKQRCAAILANHACKVERGGIQAIRVGDVVSWRAHVVVEAAVLVLTSKHEHVNMRQRRFTDPVLHVWRFVHR